MRRVLAVSIGLCAAAWSAYGQVTTAEILGVVRDPSAAAVAGASISAKHLETNQVRETVADSEGRFRVPLLPVGSYEVTVTKTGFAKYVQGPITLRLNQAADLQITLALSGVTETITVASDAVLINTTNAEIGVNFDTKRITELPLGANRNILNIALNVAGVSQLSTGQSEFASGGVNFSVNGMRTRSNNFMIDGQDSNDPSVTGLTQTIYNPEIVAEFRLITSQFLAEYGRSAGSQVNIITKRGSNDLHGSAFWFYNGNKLNSRKNTDEPLFKEAPYRVQNQAGFAVGGPVLIPKVVSGRDKTFFYVSGQKYTDRQLGTGQTITGAPTEAGRQMLQPFANRPAVKALLDFLPAAQTTGAATASFTAGGQSYRVPLGSLAGASSQKFDDWQWMLRGDHKISDKHSFNSRWLYRNALDSGAGQTTPPGYTTVVPSRRNALTAALTSTLSPRMFNELRASFQRLSTTTSAADPRSELIPSIEVPELGLTGFNAAAARTAIGLAVNLPQFRRNNTYQLQETLGVIRGGHSMKFGIDFRRQDVVSFFVPTIRGRLVYNTLQDLVDDLAQTNTINAPLRGGQPNQYYKFYDYFFFAQDEWRVRPNFTLTYGVRYESPGNPIANLATLNQPVVAANGGDERFRLTPVPPRDNNNWAARLGFNYRFGKAPGALGALTGDGRLVLRGGYSRSYDYAFINIALNVGSAFPFLNSVTLAPRTPNSFTALREASQRPPSGDINQITRTIVASDFRSPYSEQFALQLQRELAKNWAFTLGWVGTKGTALFQTIDGNPNISGTSSVRRGDPSQGVRRLRANAASSIYHSLQTSVERRFSPQFTMGAHYTWSAFIDNASEIFNPAVSGDVAVSQNSFDRSADRGRSTFDRPHRFSSTFVYELPVMRAQKGVAGKIVGGWQINGFLTFQAGPPFTPLAGIDPGFRLSGIDALVGNAIRPNVNTALDISSMRIEELYPFLLPAAVGGSRTSLFTNVTAASPLGNAGRNILRGDGISNLDFGIMKRVRVAGESRHEVQVRADFINLTATRNFGIPESRVNSAAFLNQWSTDGGNRRIVVGLRYAF